MRNGIATLSDISFVVPGATANGGGTYNLLDKRVNLRGKLSMKATVSEASSGIKSILLKPFDGLFKRKDKGAVLPVSVTGYYPRPSFGSPSRTELDSEHRLRRNRRHWNAAKRLLDGSLTLQKRKKIGIGKRHIILRDSQQEWIRVLVSVRVLV